MTNLGFQSARPARIGDPAGMNGTLSKKTNASGELQALSNENGNAAAANLMIRSLSRTKNLLRDCLHK